MSSRHRDIDALRGLAALSVVAFHASAEAAPGGTILTRVGGDLDLGVVLFFVLSGYLVGGPFLRALLTHRALPRLREYGLRRAARILPGYWTVLLAALFIGGVTLTAAPSLGIHGLLLQGVVPGQTFEGIDLAWTLSVEVLFYLFLPTAAALAWHCWGRGRSGHASCSRGRTVATGIGALWLASAGLGLAVATLGGDSPVALLVTRGLPGCLALFAPGMLVATIEETGLLRRALGHRSHAWSAMALGGCGLVAASLLHTALGGAPGYVARNLVAGIGFGMLLAGVLTLRGAHRTDGAWMRAAAAVGTVSYGVYLWHWFVARVLGYAGWSFGTGPGAWLATFAVLLGGTLPFAIASWHYVERPAIRAAAARIARDRSARRSREMSLGGAPLPS